ncbi:uncharacterized protein LOC127852222 isoform X2 [Dreissena polymorpha]|uniref:Uncharacterized protein n=2 Tax=Dreissena polymorpha TaxID=45954 RepID=A0A9D4CN64_DREPO|nr:uncharacterized protein LOC127852222 isoform X2 [Dreissena polymorpha]KAH3728057.1 hypothetical protein DPMN_054003 [Dreissena polymorpha]
MAEYELGTVRDEDEVCLRKLSVYATLRPGDLDRALLKLTDIRRPLSDLSEWTRDKRGHCEVLQDREDVPVPEQLEIREHELLVKGFDVDKRIIPGFRYLIRYIGAREYLFNGEARLLETIGLGYGKRLTFQGDRLNFNDCYFWSDSSTDGFAFSVEAIREGNSFLVLTADLQEVGTVQVHKVDYPQKELGTRVENSAVTKEVRVRFACSVRHRQTRSLINVSTQNFQVAEGVAELVKERGQKEATVTCIRGVRIETIVVCTLHMDL